MSKEQVHRLKKKLLQAKEKDCRYQVFGADRHKYEIHAPLSLEKVEAFEKKYQVRLPECYRSFLLNIGNGGKSILNSGAGPYFGIFPLGANLDILPYDQIDEHLSKKTIFHPEISEEDWENLLDEMYKGDPVENVLNERKGNLYGGTLPLGPQGCSYIHSLILNGPYKGRVVNLDRSEAMPPRFAEDKNFLDWYERWLDEIISGKLITTSPSWFGYPKNETLD